MKSRSILVTGILISYTAHLSLLIHNVTHHTGKPRKESLREIFHGINGDLVVDITEKCIPLVLFLLDSSHPSAPIDKRTFLLGVRGIILGPGLKGNPTERLKTWYTGKLR